MKDVIKPLTKNKTVRTVIIISIVIVLIVILYQVYKALKTGGNAAGEIIGAEIIQAQTGIVPPRQKVCKDVAVDCENAITRVPFIGTKIWLSRDEMILALNRLLTPAEAALASTYFREISSESLKQVIESGWFVEDARKRITFRSSLT
jgi:hypothetical protein